jgi:hypothetical protein
MPRRRSCPWAALALLVLVTMGPAPCRGSETDLTGGVLIAHAPEGVEFSTDAPAEGWCSAYVPLANAADQINRIDAETGTVWYVLAAWNEDKRFCGAEFGVDYSEDSWGMVDYGGCFPVAGLEIPTANWPDPGSGTSLAIQGEEPEDQYFGSIVPIYYFTGYAYSATPGTFALTINPDSDQATAGGCGNPPILYDIACLGAMGIFADGVFCSPEVQPTAVCCTQGVCEIVTQSACEAGGGVWYEEEESCDPNPCPIWGACCYGTGSCVMTETLGECEALGGTWHQGYDCSLDCTLIRACCVGQVCYVMFEAECEAAGGQFMNLFLDCGPPDPCTTPTNETSWGTIKSLYR